ALPLGVPERERPHAVEPLDAGVSPLAVRGEDHLGVGRAAEAVALRLELRAKLAVVVDLAVVDELETPVLACERLVARRRGVDDREPAKAERRARVRVEAAAVGAAMREGGRHALDGLALGRPTGRDDSAHPAHGFL